MVLPSKRRAGELRSARRRTARRVRRRDLSQGTARRECSYRVTIVLFDIDGTLIRTGRAGSRAMDRAFEELFGISKAFDGIQMAGRTDKWILYTSPSPRDS